MHHFRWSGKGIRVHTDLAEHKWSDGRNVVQAPRLRERLAGGKHQGEELAENRMNWNNSPEKTYH